MEEIYRFQWIDSAGKHTLELGTRIELIKRIEKFLKKAYDFRVVIRAKDEETKNQIAALFNKYNQKYEKTSFSKESKSSQLNSFEIIKEGTLGAYQGIKYSGTATAVLSAIELTPSGAQKLAEILTEKLGNDVIIKQFGENFFSEITTIGVEATADVVADIAGSTALEFISEQAEKLAEITALLGPFVTVATSAFRVYRVHQRTQKKLAQQKIEEENAVTIFSFSRKSSGEMIPILLPIKVNLIDRIISCLTLRSPTAV